MDPQLVLLAAAVVAVGFASGVLSGMFGVGGAVLTTPGIRALGATPLAAVGSTVPPIIPGAISGAYRYHKAGLVDWRVGVATGAAGSLFAVAGARLSDAVNPHLLMIATAVMLAVSGVSTWRSARRGTPADPIRLEALADEAPPEPLDGSAPDRTCPLPVWSPSATERLARPVAAVPRPSGAATRVAERPAGVAAWTGGAASRGPERPSMVILLVVGALAGSLAGVLGVGGGIVMMPAFTSVLKIPVRVAAASSLVAVAIFSIPAVVTHALLGHIDWFYAGWLAAGAIPGARVGARITMSVDERVVGLCFAVFLFVLAVVMGTAEYLALH